MTTTENESLPSRDGFPAVSYEKWRSLVETELKGASFDKRMLTPTYEGIVLKPLYRRADAENLPHLGSLPGFPPFARGTKASGYVGCPWAISQEIVCRSAGEFNHAARNSLDRGLNALNIALDQATRNGHDPDWAKPDEVGLRGLSIATLDDLRAALDGIDLGKTSIFVRSGASALPFAALLIALIRQRKKSPGELRGCIEMDPLGVLAHEGALPQSLDGAYGEMAALASWAAGNAAALQTICVHSRSWHEAGGSAVEELAFTLATGVDYLREMTRRGLDTNTTARRMRFAVTVGTDFFMEIAKLRALRILWARTVAASGGDENAQKLSLHVRASRWNKTVCDPYNNLLRATVESLAGALGGCDSMQVGAFDEVAREPDDFSQRIARNTQLILQRECHLDRVIDPAGGSWHIESLTAELAARAWKLFQEVEKLGGMGAALRAGFPQQAVAKTASRRTDAVNKRRDSIVGVNQYANLKEKPLDCPPPEPAPFYNRRVQQVASYRTSLEEAGSEIVLQRLARLIECRGPEIFEAAVEAAAAGASLGEISRAVRIHDTPCNGVAPVTITRAAAKFERLRAALDNYSAHHTRPSVFLCNMGPPREHKARADFSRGFFAAGGYTVVSPEGFSTPDAAAASLAASGSDIAVICSTDEKYPELVPPLVKAIRAQKPSAIIVLAGLPMGQEENLKTAGVDEFIHARANALELLTTFHMRFGVKL